MSREFFDQIEDEVRGLVPPELANPQTYRSSRLIKLWYGDPNVHFEVQLLSPRWSGSRSPALEIGLHLEAGSAAANDRILQLILQRKDDWRDRLPRAEHGPAIGPRAATWRRVSEVVTVPGWDEDFAGEVAERLGDYVVGLGPAAGLG